MTVRSLLTVSLLMATAWLVAATNRSPWMTADCGRLDIDWSTDSGDHTYRLRGQYSIASLDGGYATTVSNPVDRDGAHAHLCVPPGLYSVALEPGYTLERVEGHGSDEAWTASDDAAVQVVPALLVSSPVIVTAKQGQVASMNLSLVDMPGTSSEREPEPECMHGS